MAYFNGGGGGFLTLNEEKGISMEAGTEFYPLDNLKIGLTLFRIDMEDEIQYVGYYPTGYNQNTGKTRHDGVEVSLSYLWLKYLKIYGNYTYHMATFENGANNKKEMPMVPSHIANAGLEIYLPYNLTLKPEIQYVGNAFLSGDNGNSAEKLEAHTLLNFYVYYKPIFGKLGLTAFLGVDNIADVKYSSFGSDYGYGASYYPMPGITLKTGFSFTF
jgi:iron complex outermembrane receptor protein